VSDAASSSVAVRAPLLELVESIPAGAVVDDPSVPNTDVVWRSMLSGARKSVAFGHFFVAEKPSELPGVDRLSPVIDELLAAKTRGVEVRFIVDLSFLKKAPTSIDRLRSLGVDVRAIDTTGTLGGVHHAKYLVVDEEDVYVGSANFDWRSLEHIHELGLHLRSRKVAATLLSVFDADWAAAGGAGSSTRGAGPSSEFEAFGDARVQTLLSPKDHLPKGATWDLDRLVESIDSARREIRVQLLSYETIDRDGAKFEVLDAALRRAAVRGVKVHLLLSHWQKGGKKLEAARRLAETPGIDVRFVTIPEASGGFIPFARVIHAKYLVVDEALCWVGTSNWSGDYFFHGRNLGFIVESARLATELARIFDSLATGPFAEAVDPARVYEAPRIAN